MNSRCGVGLKQGAELFVAFCKLNFADRLRWIGRVCFADRFQQFGVLRKDHAQILVEGSPGDYGICGGQSCCVS